MCPEDCHYLIKCAVKRSDGTMDRTKCKEEFDKLPQTSHCREHMACWWNAHESTTEPDYCPNHCYEHKMCGYDAVPEWCHTKTWKEGERPKECYSFG